MLKRPSVSADSAVSLLDDSLELELPGELVLSLFQLLSAPHVLVIHILDLRFDALELGIQLRGEEREGETEETVRRERRSLMNWSPTHSSLVAHGNSTGGTGVWRNGDPIGAEQHGSPPSFQLIPPRSSQASTLFIL